MTKRIGILTFFWEDNPGQLFQAMATYHAVGREFTGDDVHVELVDYRPWNRRWFGKRDLTGPLVLSRRWRQHQRYRRVRQETLAISSQRLVSSDRDRAASFVRSQNYDMLVVGSDVVLHLWPDIFGKEATPPVYWLPPDMPGRKVLLSASADTTTVHKLTEKQSEIMSESAKAFDVTFVRDDISARLLGDLGVNSWKVKQIPDPTFSLDIDTERFEEAVIAVSNRIRKDGRLRVGVALPQRSWVKGTIAKLRQEGCCVISHRRNYTDREATSFPGPWEWVALLSTLDFVLTYSFHDCVFCMKQGIPAVAVNYRSQRVDRRTGMSKTRTLMERFGLEEYCYMDATLADRSGEDLQRELTDRAMAVREVFDPGRAISTSQEIGREYRKSVSTLRTLLQSR